MIIDRQTKFDVDNKVFYFNEKNELESGKITLVSYVCWTDRSKLVIENETYLVKPDNGQSYLPQQRIFRKADQLFFTERQANATILPKS